MTAAGHTDARQRLADLDASLRSRGVERATLAAGRERATDFEQLAASLSVLEHGPVADAIADGLHTIVEAQLEAFPESIFWDFDFLVATLLEDARGQADAAGYVRTCAQLIADLHALFGRGTAIRFRYVHDFQYGFDWAKWVRAEPERRRTVSPFAEPFLRYMLDRGAELLELIQNDDEEYPPLGDEQEHRNPFGFSRTPADERRLFLVLAREDLIPVETWRLDATPRFDRPFRKLRSARAETLLGIDRR